MPSHWGLEFQHMNFGGHVHSVYENPIPDNTVHFKWIKDSGVKKDEIIEIDFLMIFG